MQSRSGDIGMAVAVLAGGKSTRMGRDKAAVKVGGISMLARVVATATKVSSDVIVVGRNKETQFDDLPAKFVQDDQPGLGPIGGITTLFRSGYESAIVLSCDLPYIQESLLRWLNEQVGISSPPFAVVPIFDGWLQPLVAFYSKSILPSLEKGVSERQYSLSKILIGTEKCVTPELPREFERQIVNINSALDL